MNQPPLLTFNYDRDTLGCLSVSLFRRTSTERAGCYGPLRSSLRRCFWPAANPIPYHESVPPLSAII